MTGDFPRSDALQSQRRRGRLRDYWRATSASHPIGLYLLLWPALWALWIAGEGRPTWWVALVFVAGTVLMRSAACVINDYVSRKGEAGGKKGAQAVTHREMLGLSSILGIAALALVSTLNSLAAVYASAGLILAVLYLFSRQFIHLSHLGFGVAFAAAVPMAFAAMQDAAPPVAWWLFAATVSWVMIYEIQYAMAIRDDDAQAGLKSTAIRLGRFDRLAVGVLQLAVLGLLWQVGQMADRGTAWSGGLLLGAALFAIQQYLVRMRERRACFRAFLNNNLFGLAVFSGLFIDYLIKP